MTAYSLASSITIVSAVAFHYWALAGTRRGASILYSEDLQDGQMVGPLKIENPFAS